MAGFYIQRSPTVVPTDDGALALSLAKNQTATLQLSLPAGTWRVTVEPKIGRDNIRVTAGGQLSIDLLTVDGTTPVTLELAAPSDSGSQPVRIMLDRTR
jgi:hypothetical protein